MKVDIMGKMEIERIINSKIKAEVEYLTDFINKVRAELIAVKEELIVLKSNKDILEFETDKIRCVSCGQFFNDKDIKNNKCLKCGMGLK